MLIIKIDDKPSDNMAFLNKDAKVKINGKKTLLTKGKALTIIEKNEEFLRVALEIKGKKKIFKIKSYLVDIIKGFAQIKTPNGKIGWIVLDFIRID